MAALLSRRRFIAGLGSILVAFSLDSKLAPAQAATLPGSLNANRMLDAWIRIGADGVATVCTGKVEFGQGILTALAQIAAEELDLPIARVQMISGDTGRTPNEGYTAGSQSIEYSGAALRLAGAEVRAILLELAARRFDVAAMSLTVSDGIISATDGRKIGYGELAREVDLKREATGTVAPKSASVHKIVGQSIARLDIPAKVTGGAAYLQDLRLPDMLHGRVVRPPRYGAKLEGFDDASAKALPGVIALVRDGSFLGVVTEREEQAIKARAALLKSAKWTGGRDLPDAEKIHEHLLSLPTVDRVIRDKQAPLPAGARMLEATYRKPYLSHASIGPSCALAEFRGSQLTVWTHSQGVVPLRGSLATVLKMPPTDVRCIHAEGAGCYGHNGADDAALDAALLARSVPGRPVRLQWMRDDEFAWSPCGPAMIMKVKGAVSGGRVVDWNYELWSNTHVMRPGVPGGVNLLAAGDLAEPMQPAPPQAIPQPAGGGDRNAIPLYDFPRQRIVNHMVKAMPIRVSALRALGAYANVWAVESFVDELAAAAGADPVAFRLNHLTDPRAHAVLEMVTGMAGWRRGTTGDGHRGRGIGFAQYKNLASYVAVIADIEIDRASGILRVPRVYAAIDAGLIINPDGLANQIEGGIIQSASWTLKEAVRFDRTGITTRDWSGYPILTMPEVPKVEIRLINRPDQPALGSGEASLGPTVAAIANAFSHATGKRIRELPMSRQRVKAALG